MTMTQICLESLHGAQHFKHNITIVNTTIFCPVVQTLVTSEHFKKGAPDPYE